VAVREDPTTTGNGVIEMLHSISSSVKRARYPVPFGWKERVLEKISLHKLYVSPGLSAPVMSTLITHPSTLHLFYILAMNLQKSNIQLFMLVCIKPPIVITNKRTNETSSS